MSLYADFVEKEPYVDGRTICGWSPYMLIQREREEKLVFRISPTLAESKRVCSKGEFQEKNEEWGS